MKSLAVVLLLGFAATALGADRYELDNRIRKLQAKFDEMQRRPDKRVPDEVLRRAEGIVLLERTKAGFVFAYEGGSGVAMVKDAQGRWSAPAFVKQNQGSFGPQIGGETDFVVLTFMNGDMTHLLADANNDFGVEARGTAGDSSSGVQTGGVLHEAPVLAYSERKGFYGGADVKGGTLAPDRNDNAIYYEGASPNDVLFGSRIQPTPAGESLIRDIASPTPAR